MRCKLIYEFVDDIFSAISSTFLSPHQERDLLTRKHILQALETRRLEICCRDPYQTSGSKRFADTNQGGALPAEKATI